MEPNDYQLPSGYSITLSEAGALNCSVDSNKYSVELGNIIWNTIVKSCKINGISITD